MRGPLQQRDERVQQQRDQPGDDEQQQDAAGGLQEQVGADDRRAAAAPSAPSAGRRTGSTRAGGAGVRLRSGGGVAGRPRRRSSSGFAASSSVCRAIDCDDSVPAITAILFIGDVVGRAGRRALRELLPGLREELAPDFVVVNGENAAGGHRDHAQGGRRAAARRRRRDHARQPHLPPPRDLAVPGVRSAGSCARTTTCPRSRAAGRRSSSATASSLGRREPVAAIVHLQAGAPPLVAIDEALREVAGADQILVDMHAEVDEREGRARLVPRRQGDGGRRHPHARPDRRRPRAARAAPPTSPTSA